MGRSITFEKHHVLEQTLTLFWARGFSASSLRQLEEVTELNPGSLYYHFSNKEQLFLATLKHYVDCHLQSRIRKHLDSSKPLEGLRRFFTSGYRHPADEQYKNCCFLTATTSELHLLPPLASELICSGLNAVESGLLSQLTHAADKDLIDRPFSLPAVAQELCHLYISLQLMARLKHNQQQLDHMVKQSLDILIPHRKNLC